LSKNETLGGVAAAWRLAAELFSQDAAEVYVHARRGDMFDRKKLMALRDASVDARRKAALGLDMGDPNSLETLTRTHILIMALDAVIDELPPDAEVEALVG
jgi:hypothetical protein